MAIKRHVQSIPCSIRFICIYYNLVLAYFSGLLYDEVLNHCSARQRLHKLLLSQQLCEHCTLIRVLEPLDPIVTIPSQPLLSKTCCLAYTVLKWKTVKSPFFYSKRPLKNVCTYCIWVLSPWKSVLELPSFKVVLMEKNNKVWLAKMSYICNIKLNYIFFWYKL